MISRHSLAAEDLIALERLLEAGRKYDCPLMGAYVAMLTSADDMHTQQQVADYIGECLGVAVTRQKISDWLNGHKVMPRRLQDLARRELLEYLLADDRSMQLIELLGMEDSAL